VLSHVGRKEGTGRFDSVETGRIGGKGPEQSRCQSLEEGSDALLLDRFLEDIGVATVHSRGCGLDPTLDGIKGKGDDPIGHARHASRQQNGRRRGRLVMIVFQSTQLSLAEFVRGKVGRISWDIPNGRTGRPTELTQL